MATSAAWILSGVICLAGCTTIDSASTGSSAAAYRAGSGIVESVRAIGVAAPSAPLTRRAVPPGASVYTESTYSQPAYSYPASHPGFASDGPREPAPGGVSARTDAYQVTLRMEDGTRQVVTMARAPGAGEHIRVSPEGAESELH